MGILVFSMQLLPLLVLFGAALAQEGTPYHAIPAQARHPEGWGCLNPEWKGDGFCDDDNNEGCAWDGGDCCNQEYQYWDYYCTTEEFCQCLDPAASARDLFEERAKMEAFQNDCYMICWKGDGFCDDENNNEGCEYDGGDCCNNDYQWWDYYCTDCECLDPEFV